MYDEMTLAKYPYFENLMKTKDKSSFLDSLTGLVARRYMLDYVRSLIAAKTPFTLAMLDLDNFKEINDRYGHRTGDEVLATVADGLRAYAGEKAVIGRFGGDEFLIVNTITNEYNRLHRFYDGMFIQYEGMPPNVFRRTLDLRKGQPYITATLGSASFPNDATDFESLFSVMDKALYRGKSKGRNCFIIYVPEKHMSLDITQLSSRSLYETYRNMRDAFLTADDILVALPVSFTILSKNLGFKRLLWVMNGSLIDVNDNCAVPCEDVTNLMENGLYSAMDCKGLSVSHPKVYDYLKKIDMRSLLLMEIGIDGEFGYIGLCPEASTYHIWQDAEIASGFVFASLLASRLKELKTSENK